MRAILYALRGIRIFDERGVIQNKGAVFMACGESVADSVCFEG